MISAGENEISLKVSCHYKLPFTVGSMGGVDVSGDNPREIGAALISGNQDDGYLDMAVVPVLTRTVREWAWFGEYREREITVPPSNVYHLRLKMDSLNSDQQVIASELMRNFFRGKGNTPTICSGLGGRDRSHYRIMAMDNGK